MGTTVSALPAGADGCTACALGLARAPPVASSRAVASRARQPPSVRAPRWPTVTARRARRPSPVAVVATTAAAAAACICTTPAANVGGCAPPHPVPLPLPRPLPSQQRVARRCHRRYHPLPQCGMVADAKTTATRRVSSRAWRRVGRRRRKHPLRVRPPGPLRWCRVRCCRLQRPTSRRRIVSSSSSVVPPPLRWRLPLPLPLPPPHGPRGHAVPSPASPPGPAASAQAQPLALPLRRTTGAVAPSSPTVSAGALAVRRASRPSGPRRSSARTASCTGRERRG